MRILMLGWELPPHITGGLGIACHGIAGALATRGADVLFVAPRLFGDEDGSGLRLVAAGDVPLPEGEAAASLEELPERLQLAFLESPLRPYQSAGAYARTLARLRHDTDRGTRSPGEQQPFEGGYGPNLAAEVERYAHAVAELARREHFDIVHAHDWMTFPAGLLARRVSGAPLVAHVHSSEYDRAGDEADPAIAAFERVGLQRADRVVCVSHLTRDVVVSRHGVTPERTRVVHNAVTRREARERRHVASEGPPTVLFLGRLTRQKGPEFFLRAAALVAARRPDVRFVVGGDGDLRDELVERAVQLGLSRRVFFTGFLGPEEVERAYAEADLYVMPSVSEPFGLAPLEALSMDTPVIVASQSGVAEILPSCPKVAYGDVDDLAAKILTLLEKPELREALVRAGCEEVARLRWDRAAAQLEDIYGELLLQGAGT